MNTFSTLLTLSIRWFTLSASIAVLGLAQGVSPVFAEQAAEQAATPTASSTESASGPTGESAAVTANDEAAGNEAAPALLLSMPGGTASSARALAESAAPALPAADPSTPRAPTEPNSAGAVADRIVERMLSEITRAEGEPRGLSLAEAVRAAVENNPGIRAMADVPQSAAYAPLGATGAFDPSFRINAEASDLHAPVGSALASGLSVFQEKAVRAGTSISKLLRSGANVGVEWQTGIIDTNSRFFTINPRYENQLNFSLRQPLLRNFWAANENSLVLVSRSRAEESVATFEVTLADFVARVIDAYWANVQAAAELEVAKRSVALAQEVVRDAEAKVAVGLLPPVATKEAQADAAAREETAISAENDLIVSGRNLQHEVMLGAAQNRAPEPIQPIEEHLVTPVELDRATSLRTAVESRAEIRGATLALGRQRTEEKRARNALLPSLDIVARYGLLGLAGDAKPITDDMGNVQYSPYNGDYGDSLNTMINNDFQDYGVGLEFEVPFGNASAKATLAQAEIGVRRASHDLEQVVSTVALDVERALANVASAAKRVTASKVARELAEENLRNQTRRFELGAVTTKDVLDFQEKLARAMASEVRAISDHARAVTRLRVADGTLLTRFGIEVQNPNKPGQPWWYQF